MDIFNTAALVESDSSDSGDSSDWWVVMPELQTMSARVTVPGLSKQRLDSECRDLTSQTQTWPHPVHAAVLHRSQEVPDTVLYPTHL